MLYGVPRRYAGSCGVSCELISCRCQLSWSAAPPVPLFMKCGRAELRHSYCRCTALLQSFYSSGLGTYLPHSFLFKSHNKLTLCTNGPSIPHLCGPMHAAPLGEGDGAAKSVNYTCVNYKLDGRKATFWNEQQITSSSSHSNEQKTHYPPL